MLRKAKQNPTTKERGAAAPKVKTIYIYYIKIHRQKSKFHKLTPLTLTLLELSWTHSNPVPSKAKQSPPTKQQLFFSPASAGFTSEPTISEKFYIESGPKLYRDIPRFTLLMWNTEKHDRRYCDHKAVLCKLSQISQICVNST